MGSKRDQECGKSELNGTALDAWAFNPRFSLAGCVTLPISRGAVRKTATAQGLRTDRRVPEVVDAERSVRETAQQGEADAVRVIAAVLGMERRRGAVMTSRWLQSVEARSTRW